MGMDGLECSPYLTARFGEEVWVVLATIAIERGGRIACA